MNKDLTKEFPDILGDANQLMKDWKECYVEVKTLQEKYNICKKAIRDKFSKKILESITDPILKQILSQPVASRFQKSNVLDLIIDYHLTDNGPMCYTHARMTTQTHHITKFDEFDKYLEKSFFIPELNAEIRYKEKDFDKENLILWVTEMSETSG